ncbi:MAG: DUF87 domain-containing protein [Pseudomonadota bacterium]
MNRIEKLLRSKRASWVFDHNITWEDDIWKADFFDVEQVHKDARRKYLDLLFDITEGESSVQSRIIMFQGQSGAGKTHLLRALRSYSHCADKGFFGYAQMTPDVKNYANYYLRRLINSLEKPYSPITRSENSLIRLSQTLVADSKLVSTDQLHHLREAELNDSELAEVIIAIADNIVASDEFCEHDIDINIVRALLYIQRNDPRIDQRVRQYLYGSNLNTLNASSVAALDPNEGEDRAFEIIESLGRIMWITKQAALVFCIDQVEDLRFFDNAEERFQKAIRDLIQIANRLPSAIIMISCLDDFYFQMRDYLPQSFIDRIEKSQPLILHETRSEEEARMILERRLKYILDGEGEEDSDEYIEELSSQNEIASTSLKLEDFFGIDFVSELSGLSTRRLLEAVEYRRKEICELVPPLAVNSTVQHSHKETSVNSLPKANRDQINDIQQHWERFVGSYDAEIPADEDDLLGIISSAVKLSQCEGLKDIQITIEPAWQEDLAAIDLTIEHDSTTPIDTRLFVCNRTSQGGGLKRQLDRVVSAAEGKNAIIVRASDFPPSPKSATHDLLRQFRKNGGRSTVIPVYEWERMITVIEFHQNYKELIGFEDWMKAAQVLSDLPFIKQVLRLDLLNCEPIKKESTDVKPILSSFNGADPLQENEAGNTDDNVHHIDFSTNSNPAQNNNEITDTSSDPTSDNESEETVFQQIQAGENEVKIGHALSTSKESVIFPVNTLKRHAAFLGGSGSGKTTLALTIIEQLLEQKLPVVLIDRKGDLCSYANPQVWEETALCEERLAIRQRLQEEVDVAVYTPGRISGRPISITLMPNGVADLPAHEQQQLANVSAAAISDMLHLGNSATHQRQEGILTVALRLLGTISSREVTLADLIGLLEDDHSEVVDETYRMDPSGKLRRDLVAQLDSLRHRNWALFEGGGEPLMMESLLGRGKFAAPDKTRLSIIYTGFLGDNENIMFWVAQFLSEALRFCQRNPNEDLQAVIMFDEADLYIPANSKPATKEPLESLLKRARSAGVGIMLATQSPGDLDYKSRDQITSWFIGKVREDTALRKLKAAFSSDTGIDPATALPSQKVGQFHLIQEGVVKPIMADRSLIKADQVPFDQIEDLAADTTNYPLKRKKKPQLGFDFG